MSPIPKMLLLRLFPSVNGTSVSLRNLGVPLTPPSCPSAIACQSPTSNSWVSKVHLRPATILSPLASPVPSCHLLMPGSLNSPCLMRRSVQHANLHCVSLQIKSLLGSLAHPVSRATMCVSESGTALLMLFCYNYLFPVTPFTSPSVPVYKVIFPQAPLDLPLPLDSVPAPLSRPSEFPFTAFFPHDLYTLWEQKTCVFHCP
jgi:hypothetical protein